MTRDECGQSILELTMVLPIIVLAVTEAFWILHATVKRTECARVVFEATRSALESETTIPSKNGVLLEKSSAGITGRKKCGTHREILFLPHLGFRKPGVSL